MAQVPRGVSRRGRRRLGRLGLVVAVVAGAAGCGQAAGRDLCTQYAELTSAVDGLRALTPSNASDDVVAKALLLKTAIDRLQAVSEGHVDTLVSALRTATDDVEQSALAARTARDTAAPLLADSMDEVKVAFADLQDSLDTQCVG